MRKLIIALLVAFVAYQGVTHWSGSSAPEDVASAEHGGPQTFEGRSAESSEGSERFDAEPRAGRQFESGGTVERVLSDDNKGSRHQRFIVRLASGRTVLIAHNIDLAPRVEGLREGDTVSFSGEFEENDKGGVVHWTHHDPAGRHVAGWIRYRGRTYQ